ncbi:MAG: amidinotransferase [Gammaproteobacteria bacterium]|nr:amidinotransferase [Gammaproteobacteria bacterium]
MLGQKVQTTDTIVMVSPDFFQYNHETAESNVFAHPFPLAEVTQIARVEFNQAVAQLKKAGLRVFVLPSPPTFTPDAVFPNNWFTTHTVGPHQSLLVLYPMFTPNRREERQLGSLSKLLNKAGVRIERIVDLTAYEKTNQALEGTGSMVFDRINQVAYAAISSRTSARILKDFSKKTGFKIISFMSIADGQPIYHTNVMMSIGKRFVIITAETISNANERKRVLNHLQQSGRTVIIISTSQMKAMAGNIIELKNKAGESLIVMSKSAFQTFTDHQRDLLQAFGKLIVLELDVIEKIGGGSARCMIAEIFS